MPSPAPTPTRSAPPDLLAPARPNRSSLRAEPVRSKPRRVVHFPPPDSGAVLDAARHHRELATPSSGVDFGAVLPITSMYSTTSKEELHVSPSSAGEEQRW